MYSDLVAGEDLQAMAGHGAFRVEGRLPNPLLIEDLFAFELFFGEHYLLDHASRRPLILRDLHTQVGALYRNSVSGGKVFIENVCTTDQFEPYRNCLSFVGQQVWARQLNPERADPEVLNDGSRLWVLGFKTEKSGTAFLTQGGGSTEVLGGIFNLSRKGDPLSPAIINRNSDVAVFASTTDHRRDVPGGEYPVVEERRDEVTKRLYWDQFPRRDKHLVVVPLYAGRSSGSD
jgi:hypothetical protein